MGIFQDRALTQTPPAQLVEFQLDGTAKHIIHRVRLEELPEDSLTTIQEEGTSNSISGLDDTTESTSTAIAMDDDDEFPEWIKNLLG